VSQVRLIHGDCREHMSVLLGDILLSDPPYGIGYRVNERRFSTRGEGLRDTEATATAERPMIAGDDFAFDPQPWLGFARVALFGANHFYNRLPDGGRWIVWDKRRDSAPDDHSDCELVWTNVRGADRIHRQKWRGVVREGEENCSNSIKLHPNQKPVALLRFVLEQVGARPGHTVIDPFMGSGSTGVAALRLGMNFIGCEIDAAYFQIAQERLTLEQQTIQYELMA
jgi:site-specific DNA-methyltransferase (adenine-specific)